VDADDHARITDFGLTTVTQNIDSIQTTSGHQGHTARWTAPEILNEEGTYSIEADVFAFAMVMIEARHTLGARVGFMFTVTLGGHRCSLVPLPFLPAHPPRL
jgi:serine/threonine protein kinase